MDFAVHVLAAEDFGSELPLCKWFCDIKQKQLGKCHSHSAGKEITTLLPTPLGENPRALQGAACEREPPALPP